MTPAFRPGKITMTIEDVLKQIVDWPETSKIFLDNRTSTLIVRNTPTNLAILEEVLEALDVKLSCDIVTHLVIEEENFLAHRAHWC